MRQTNTPDSLVPPTQSRAGRLIVATVAMGLATSALLYWKLAQGRPAEKTAAVAAPRAIAPSVRHEAPPPPPPPAPTTEKPQPEKTAPAKSSGAPNRCSGACTGSASAALQSALRAKAGAARGCYERALRQNEMLQARMTVGLRVGSTGRVCGASVVENGLGDPGVASCVLGLMRSGTLPAPEGGCVDVQVPMSFVGRS